MERLAGALDEASTTLAEATALADALRGGPGSELEDLVAEQADALERVTP